jgi:hypothetical protein
MMNAVFAAAAAAAGSSQRSPGVQQPQLQILQWASVPTVNVPTVNQVLCSIMILGKVLYHFTKIRCMNR